APSDHEESGTKTNGTTPATRTTLLLPTSTRPREVVTSVERRDEGARGQGLAPDAAANPTHRIRRARRATACHRRAPCGIQSAGLAGRVAPRLGFLLIDPFQNVISPSKTVSSNVRPDTVSTNLAPEPPPSAVAVKGRFEPAPKPVTVAVPVRTAIAPRISTAVIGPVTYITFVSKLPLPGVPAAGLGASAGQRSRLWPSRKWIPNWVKTGTNEGAPVPPVTSDVPAPWTTRPPSPAHTRATLVKNTRKKAIMSFVRFTISSLHLWWDLFGAATSEAHQSARRAGSARPPSGQLIEGEGGKACGSRPQSAAAAWRSSRSRSLLSQ